MFIVNEQTVIYPGTFDPITNGHVDLVERAARLFGRVTIAIAHSAKKTPLFSLKERVELCHASLGHIKDLQVKGFSNLLTDFAREERTQIVLRGVRTVADFEYEYQLASMNRALFTGFESVFLTPKDDLSHISSSLVREIASLDGDISGFVPAPVAAALKAKFSASTS